MAQAADFFVSYTSADRAWAEWVAWQLEQAGYSVIVQAWDFEPGDNFVARMRDALEQADRTLALVSTAYLASPYCTDEWTGAFLHDPDGRNRLLQVRIEACELPRLLRAQIHVDLVGLPRQQARARLLAGVQRGRRKPSGEPPFPHDQAGGDGPRFPGQAPEVTNLPPRNPDFSGRGRFLEDLHEQLAAAGAPRWSRLPRCTGWVGSARPSSRWSTPTGTPATTTSSGGSRPSDRSPSRDCWPGWPGAWGYPSRPTRRSCWRACGTPCASGTAGCWSTTTPKAPATSRPTAHRAAAAGCWSPPGRRTGIGGRPRCGWMCCTARRR